MTVLPIMQLIRLAECTYASGRARARLLDQIASAMFHFENLLFKIFTFDFIRSQKLFIRWNYCACEFLWDFTIERRLLFCTSSWGSPISCKEPSELFIVLSSCTNFFFILLSFLPSNILQIIMILEARRASGEKIAQWLLTWRTSEVFSSGIRDDIYRTFSIK